MCIIARSVEFARNSGIFRWNSAYASMGAVMLHAFCTPRCVFTFFWRGCSASRSHTILRHRSSNLCVAPLYSSLLQCAAPGPSSGVQPFSVAMSASASCKRPTRRVCSADFFDAPPGAVLQPGALAPTTPTLPASPTRRLLRSQTRAPPQFPPPYDPNDPFALTPLLPTSAAPARPQRPSRHWPDVQSGNSGSDYALLCRHRRHHVCPLMCPRPAGRGQQPVGIAAGNRQRPAGRQWTEPNRQSPSSICQRPAGSSSRQRAADGV